MSRDHVSAGSRVEDVSTYHSFFKRLILFRRHIEHLVGDSPPTTHACTLRVITTGFHYADSLLELLHNQADSIGTISAGSLTSIVCAADLASSEQLSIQRDVTW